ncbi:MAG: ribosomal protein S18-alanine N-acetyltransferase [Gemmatimonadetes bacterium]|nr:ribosomal protein S18-alanine N-acetyltransferase [Gemmatimonadota bacterium]NNM32512.1 ribosomal protein S18-alanine N-acetyltransferase [Gemmatimonadota bacterium]
MRPAEIRDLDDIVEIETESFSDPWSRAAFQSLLRREDADVFVADATGGVVGYAVLWATLDEAELANVAVAPGVRREGVGARLVQRALEAAADRGASTVYLEVRASNEAAARMYEGFGFQQLGVRKNYYSRPTEDAKVMALRLGGSAGEGIPGP